MREVAGIEDTCSACGERNPPGSQFCLFCGVFLGWEEKPADGAPANSPARATDGQQPGGSADRAAGRLAPTQETLVGHAATAELLTLAGNGIPAGPAHLLTCPTCQHGNDPGRRFCSRCGTALHTPDQGVPPPARRAPWWRRTWQRVANPERRASRRAYRRSLPALYRWRRTLVFVLAVAGIGSGLAVVGHNPALLARTAWHDLRGDVVQVEDVGATTVPPTSVVAGTSAAAAVDGDPDTLWSTSWKAPATPPACGDVTGTGGLQLTLRATRIREIHVLSGATDASLRTLQLLPRTLHITTSDGTCVTAELTRSATSQTVPIDTQAAVTSVTITVAATYAPTDPRATPVVSISEVSLWARPS